MSVQRVLTAIAWIPWALVVVGGAVAVYWTLEPTPLRLTYVAPHFTSEPVSSAEEAEEHAVTETKGGGVLWRYVEYCIDRPFTGTTRRVWINNALVWHAPDIPTVLSRTRGCSSASIPVDVPTSSPARTFDFVQWMEIPVNPLRTERIGYAPIRLKILNGTH